MAASISIQNKFPFRSGITQHRCLNKGTLQSLESIFSCRGPFKWLSRFQKLEWSGNVSKLEDKTSVIGAKSKELSHLCDACRPWPLLDCLHFFRISTDSVLTDYVAKVSHLLLKQVAFLG